MGPKKSVFLSKNENRMLVTLLLGIGYPFIFTAFFPIFVFLIMPLASFAYWLVVAGAWLIALAIVLPQMRSPIPLGPGGYVVDPESSLDLHRIRSRGSTDDFLDRPEKEEEEIFVNEQQRRLSSDSSEKSMSRLVVDSTQIEPVQRTSTPPHERIFEERKAMEVDAEPCERRSLLAGDVELEETIVAKETTIKSLETFTSTTYDRTYECSLPSPEHTSGGHTKNTVFIFVNNGSEKELREE